MLFCGISSAVPPDKWEISYWLQSEDCSDIEEVLPGSYWSILHWWPLYGIRSLTSVSLLTRIECSSCCPWSWSKLSQARLLGHWLPQGSPYPHTLYFFLLILFSLETHLAQSKLSNFRLSSLVSPFLAPEVCSREAISPPYFHGSFVAEACDAWSQCLSEISLPFSTLLGLYPDIFTNSHYHAFLFPQTFQCWLLAHLLWV